MVRQSVVVAAVVALGLCLVAGTASASPIIELTPYFPPGVVTPITWSFDSHGTFVGNAIDNNTGSVFYSSDSNWQGWFIVLDLGQDYLIDHYTMRYYTPNTGFAVTNRFTVGNTLSGTLRVTGGVFDDFTGSVAGNGALQPDYVAVNTAVVAQYVDISVPAGSAGTGKTGGVYELQIFGSVVETPEPGTMLLLGTGAVGLFGYARRRMMK